MTLPALLAAMPARAQDPVAELDRIFAFATSETPGCAVGLARNGTVVAERAYGLADVAQRRPLTAQSRFDIGSTQKQFVAAAVLLLVEDGRLALTDHIHKFFPELPDYGHPLTVDHLLTHTSGVRDWTGLQGMAPEGTEALPLILRQRGLNFTPGERWAYSNSGFVLLKEIVARVSGVSFAEFARRRLFEPLGMSSSAYVEDILQGSGDLAIGYQKDGAGWTQYIRLGAERGGGAIISTAGDLLRWNAALTDGRLGSFVTTKLQEPARLANGRTLTYARGLMINATPTGRIVSHSGGAAGYSTWLGRVTDHGLSIAVLCNFDPVSATNLAGQVADLYLPPAPSAAESGQPVAVPGVDVAPRAGLYFDTMTGDPLRLATNGGRLAVINGPALVPVSAERFRPQHASLFFRSDDDFTLDFQSPDAFTITSMEGATSTYRRATAWTPGAAERRGLDGRYESAELGTVFELLPTATGNLVVRFERKPDEVQEMQPAAPDTWMRGMVVLRVRRDASGAATGFTLSNPVAQGMTFTRAGDRKAGSPPLAPHPADSAPAAPAAPATAAPSGAAPAPAGLVGEYEMAPGRRIAITLEDGQLFGQPTGNAKRPLAHVSGATFGVGAADAPVTTAFTLGADVRATALVLRQNGTERTLPRVP